LNEEKLDEKKPTTFILIGIVLQ